MQRFDLSPLFRSTIGFDRLARLADAATRVDDAALGYPPYNIEKTGEDAYRISMAVAGFGQDDLEITLQENALIVAGKAKDDAKSGQVLYRGIARRAFERRFQVADHIRVTGASLDNGLLHIELVREVPEAMKPRTIRIETAPAAQAKVLEQQAA
jgi:molecular chaperone IbpA